MMDVGEREGWVPETAFEGSQMVLNGLNQENWRGEDNLQRPSMMDVVDDTEPKKKRHKSSGKDDARRKKQLSRKVSSSDENNKTRKAWTKEEDQMILDLMVSKGSDRKWQTIADQLNNALGCQRSGKQCRTRWVNHLDPSIVRTPWSPEEEAMILEKQRELGNKWSEIATFLPGRTQNAIKNHWYSQVRRQKRLEAEEDTKQKQQHHHQEHAQHVQGQLHHHEPQNPEERASMMLMDGHRINSFSSSSTISMKSHHEGQPSPSTTKSAIHRASSSLTGGLKEAISSSRRKNSPSSSLSTSKSSRKKNSLVLKSAGQQQKSSTGTISSVLPPPPSPVRITHTLSEFDPGFVVSPNNSMYSSSNRSSFSSSNSSSCDQNRNIAPLSTRSDQSLMWPFTPSSRATTDSIIFQQENMPSPYQPLNEETANQSFDAHSSMFWATSPTVKMSSTKPAFQKMILEKSESSFGGDLEDCYRPIGAGFQRPNAVQIDTGDFQELAQCLMTSPVNKGAKFYHNMI